MMHKDRITIRQQGFINHHKKVVYWMQGAQRVEDNHALIRAIDYANHHKMSLVVIFNIVKNYKEANARHYIFMLEGIKEVYESLQSYGISFKLLVGDVIANVIAEVQDAQALMMDQAYMNIPRKWRDQLLDNVDASLHVEEIDTDLIVPVKIASQKVEYGAYTIRPKLHKKLDAFMDLVQLPNYEGATLANQLDFDLANIEQEVASFPIDQTITKTKHFTGGAKEAFQRLQRFISEKVNMYPDRNEPGKLITSTLSPYIHFGQISTQRIIMELKDAKQKDMITQEAYDSVVEQVFVRRELAFNYTYYNQGYDTFETMTEPWAYQTMAAHQNDPKTFIYSLQTLESAQTHDPYWNAAMQEMIKSGYMHNYMRMYWAKKIIEWSTDYETAYHVTLHLNNKYFLDGRDPNSYTGVAWNYGKHDRAWTERAIFGKLRYMNDKGLERKFNMKAYIEYVDAL